MWEGVGRLAGDLAVGAVRGEAGVFLVGEVHTVSLVVEKGSQSAGCVRVRIGRRKLTWIHRPHITLGQQSSLLSAGYGFSVCGEYLGTSESTVAHVQHASDVSPGRITDRGIFMLGRQSRKSEKEFQI